MGRYVGSVLHEYLRVVVVRRIPGSRFDTLLFGQPSVILRGTQFTIARIEHDWRPGDVIHLTLDGGHIGMHVNDGPMLHLRNLVPTAADIWQTD